MSQTRNKKGKHLTSKQIKSMKRDPNGWLTNRQEVSIMPEPVKTFARTEPTKEKEFEKELPEEFEKKNGW